MTSLPLAHDPDSPAADGPPPADGGIEVHLPRGPLIGLLLLNTLLTILTLGFYRFWARTKVRRVLWGAVSLRGDAFVYTGTGKELFIGFLVALVALLPFGVIIAILNAMIPPAAFGQRFAFQIVVALGAGLLGLMAMYFARRYLLTRTRWRGIHGGQDRELGRFMLKHLNAYLLVLVSFGLLQPKLDARMYNYRTGISWFGTERFRATATSAGLWSVYLPSWLLFVVGYGAMIVGFMPLMTWSAAVQEAQVTGVHPGPMPAFEPTVWIVAAILITLGTAGFFLYAIRRSIAFLGATQLGDMLFNLPLRTRQVLYIPLVGTLVYVVSLVLMVAVGVFFVRALGPGNTALFLLPLVLMVVFLSLNSLISVAWTQVEVLRQIGRHLRLRNMGVLDDLLNRGQPAPTRGEGLADAIGDIGIGA
ncbi:DUF898 family protein [Niveispirillum sp.]|uniref:DUF898 family protein n=1 Tax=Niveispirillum sp. TaxID=1917217 RepID=UPI001B4DF5C0|nr:DUF898 family protein [Niveispirillum sp.]MBP7335036.1 DUF898 family protein [Niveispirillum sp.]